MEDNYIFIGKNERGIEIYANIVYLKTADERPIVQVARLYTKINGEYNCIHAETIYAPSNSPYINPSFNDKAD